MKSQAILKQGAFSLVFEQAPDKKVRIMLYVGKFYVMTFDATMEQIRDIYICMSSKQKRYIDQTNYDKDWFSRNGWHMGQYES